MRRIFQKKRDGTVPAPAERSGAAQSPKGGLEVGSSSTARGSCEALDHPGDLVTEELIRESGS